MRKGRTPNSANPRRKEYERLKIRVSIITVRELTPPKILPAIALESSAPLALDSGGEESGSNAQYTHSKVCKDRWYVRRRLKIDSLGNL